MLGAPGPGPACTPAAHREDARWGSGPGEPSVPALLTLCPPWGQQPLTRAAGRLGRTRKPQSDSLPGPGPAHLPPGGQKQVGVRPGSGSLRGRGSEPGGGDGCTTQNVLETSDLYGFGGELKLGFLNLNRSQLIPKEKMSLLWPLLLVPTLPGPPVTAASASTQRGQGPVRSLGLRSPSAWGGAALPARPARAPGSSHPQAGVRSSGERRGDPVPCAPAALWRPRGRGSQGRGAARAGLAGSARALGGHDPRSRCSALPSPAGSSLSSESSPVSSPATNHSSPASTPKRVPMGPIIVPPGGHSVPSTPPVVTIAPTKTVNGVWRSESRQVSAGHAGGCGKGDRAALAWRVRVLEENATVPVGRPQPSTGPGLAPTTHLRFGGPRPPLGV